MTTQILVGDCRERLRELPDGSVHCVVTSPPYFGLRDYGTASWSGGDPGCDHKQTVARHDGGRVRVDGFNGSARVDSDKGAMNFRTVCGKCGAVRTDSQIGLEPTPDAYVAEMVAVFREVRRVLRDDGTVWLNLGDSYGGPKGNTAMTGGRPDKARGEAMYGGVSIAWGKPKDLIGIPWRVAFALQADGWYLRSDIIWSKPNPMPESVTDRPTKAHEYLFLLSKRDRYFYDAEAIAEPALQPFGNIETATGRYSQHKQAAIGQNQTPTSSLGANQGNATRNRRTVWTVASQPFSDAHFATFPPALIEPCIMAGTSEKGCCSKCGAPWQRQTDRKVQWPDRRGGKLVNGDRNDAGMACNAVRETTTTGWAPSCACDAPVVPCVVLDPFGGAGTTALVADRLGRDAILIELNPVYAAMAEKRLQNDAGMFAAASVAGPEKDVEEQLGLL